MADKPSFEPNAELGEINES